MAKPYMYCSDCLGVQKTLRSLFQPEESAALVLSLFEGMLMAQERTADPETLRQLQSGLSGAMDKMLKAFDEEQVVELLTYGAVHGVVVKVEACDGRLILPGVVQGDANITAPSGSVVH